MGQECVREEGGHEDEHGRQKVEDPKDGMRRHGLRQKPGDSSSDGGGDGDDGGEDGRPSRVHSDREGYQRLPYVIRFQRW